MYFEGYGELNWLNPKDYYADSWKYVCTAQGANEEFYDIVAVKGSHPCEFRFTIIL